MNITEERALALLGDGIEPEIVAASIGVTPSYISQLMSREDFRSKVLALRYDNLAEHTTRDKKYYSLEDRLIEKLEQTYEFETSPLKIARILQIVNGVKHRGNTAAQHEVQNTQIVNITLPQKASSSFVVNVANQVVSVDNRSVVTLQSQKMLDIAGQQKELIHDTGTTVKASAETVLAAARSIAERRQSGGSKIAAQDSDTLDI